MLKLRRKNCVPTRARHGDSGAIRLLVPLVAGASTVALLAAGQVVPWAGSRPEAHTKDAAVKAAADYGKLPLSFELNKGQSDATVDFVARGKGYGIFVSPTGTVTSLTKRAFEPAPGEEAPPLESSVVKMGIVGGNADAQSAGVGKLPGVVNDYTGGDRSKWLTGIPTYGKVSYREVYPGIDLAYYGSKGGLEYDFVVKPGSDPHTVGLSFEGVNGLSIAANGDLVLATPAGDLRQNRPVVYQEIDGKRRPVDGGFVLRPGNQVGFEIGSYDATRPLVIDPVLDYSTFLGGASNDFGWGIAVNAAGETFVGGETGSAVFPRGNDVPPGVTKPIAGIDAFVLKMNATGSALSYLTFLGGSKDDSGQDLAIDGSDNAYITGSTASGSSGTAFPTLNAYDSTCGSDGNCNGNADAFVTKLDSTGALSYSTFLGGSGTEWNSPGTPYSGAAGIAVKGAKVYVHGSTFSGDFPTTASGYQQTCGSCADGLADGYLAVLKTNLSGSLVLKYSTFTGGNGEEQAKGVAIDSSGNAYLTGISVSENGSTNSFGSPMLQAYHGGYSDAYVIKVNPAASGAYSRVYSTFLGGGGLEEGWGIAVNGSGNAYVTGYTTSGPAPDTADPNDPKDSVTPYFPITGGVFDSTYGGRGATTSGSTLFLEGDAFVTEMKPGGGILRSTFVGGPSADYGQAIALDSAGDVYITGWTTCRLQDNRATTTPIAATGDVTSGSNVITNVSPALTSADIGRPISGAGIPTDTRVSGASGTNVTMNAYATASATGVSITVSANEEPDQFTSVDNVTVPSGRNPGDSDVTGVGDCDGASPGSTINPGIAAGVFPQVGSVTPAVSGIFANGAMNTTYLGFELHNSPTGVFVTKLDPALTTAAYSVLLDGPGFDRGFGIAVRGSGATAEAYITGRTGRLGYPNAGSPNGTGTAYDTTYNGSGRDTFITKLVG